MITFIDEILQIEQLLVYQHIFSFIQFTFDWEKKLYIYLKQYCRKIVKNLWNTLKFKVNIG